MLLIRIIKFFCRNIRRRFTLFSETMKSSFYSSKSLIKYQSPGQISLAKKRLCIFSHFDIHNIIDPHVINHLQNLSKLDCAIIFVSACDQ